MDPEIAFSTMAGDEMDLLITLVSKQMLAKKGLKVCGQAGSDTIKKELEQLMYHRVMHGKD